MGTIVHRNIQFEPELDPVNLLILRQCSEEVYSDAGMNMSGESV